MALKHPNRDLASSRRETWLPYGKHAVTEEDIAAVVQTLRSDWLTQGPQIDKFEAAVAERCGARHGVAFANGTAALHAACLAAGVGPGGEAITTPLTFAATANAVVYCGGTPIFGDVRADTLNLDPSVLEKLATPRTKAILPVDFAGLPADLDAILVFAEKRGLTVIEDACHALGASYGQRKVGSVSHMTVFSFHPVKHVACGEGGMVLTDNGRFAKRLKKLRHHGISVSDAQKPWKYEIPDLGYNYRLSDIHSALGLSQLQRLDANLARREQIARHYREAFDGQDAISVPSLPSDRRHAWHIFVVLLNLEKLSAGRDAFIEALRAENIGAMVHYPLVHLQPYYRERFGTREGSCPVAEGIFPRLVTLPLFPTMTDRDVQDVVETVNRVCRSLKK